MKTLVASRDHVASQSRGELTILSVSTGEYYGLDEVGARVWSLLQEPRTFDELQATLLAEYAVDPAQMKADLSELLSRLQERGLIS